MCRDMPKRGGKGLKRQPCELRVCDQVRIASIEREAERLANADVKREQREQQRIEQQAQREEEKRMAGMHVVEQEVGRLLKKGEGSNSQIPSPFCLRAKLMTQHDFSVSKRVRLAGRRLATAGNGTKHIASRCIGTRCGDSNAGEMSFPRAFCFLASKCPLKWTIVFRTEFA